MSFDKKGTVIDNIFFVVILFAVAVLTIVGYKVFDEVNNHLQAVDTIPQIGKDVSQNFYDAYISIFDYGYLMVLVFLFLATVVLGAMVDTHPILYFLSAFLSIIVIILAAIFANTFDEFASSSQLSSYASQFTIIPFVFNHFVLIITVFIMVVAGITYMRVRG